MVMLCTTLFNYCLGLCIKHHIHVSLSLSPSLHYILYYLANLLYPFK